MKLTLPQQDVYFEQSLFPDDPIYNIGAKISIKGKIDYKIFDEAYVVLINQHDTFKSFINNSGGEVTFEAIDGFVPPLQHIDFSEADKPGVHANDFMQNLFEAPFDLGKKEFLHKFILVKVSPTFHYLFSVYHHIITDGWGTSLMFGRLVQIYNELTDYGKIMTEYPYSYNEFAKNDHTYSISETFDQDRLYWKEKFITLPTQLFEKIGEDVRSNRSARQVLTLDRSIYKKLELLAKKIGCSTFHVILGILYLYFGRKYQKNDFSIGIPVLNRATASHKRTVGLFMGLSVLRVTMDFENSFDVLVKTIKDQLRQDFRHQRFPLGKIIKDLGLFQSKENLFNMILSYEKQDYSSQFSGTETDVTPMTHGAERVALAIYVREFTENDPVKIDFDYNINYFNDRSMVQLLEHINNLLHAVIENDRIPLKEYDYLSAKEKQQVISDFNKTEWAYPHGGTVIEFFKKRLDKNKDKIALEDDKKKYTYEELNYASDLVANHILNSTDKSSPAIGVLMDRGCDLIAVLLGVFKSGKAYIPLDPSFPALRLNYIIEHSELKQLISSSFLKNKVGFKHEFLDVEKILHGPAPLGAANTEKVSDTSLAYIIYTSGSTGNPKGVCVNHGSLMNFLLSICHRPKITSDDHLFSVTTQSFDISILEFFAPLISGGTIYLASRELMADPIALKDKLNEKNSSIIQATPGFFQMLFNVGWKGGENMRVFCGGDLLSQALAAKLLNSSRELWNMYGPTETTIWSSCKKMKKAEDSVNIGEPLHNTQFYILDTYLQPLPIGVVGDIYIGGVGVAQGYFRNTKLTKDKFVDSPFDKGEIIYHTGDLGKWNHDGEIEFCGRGDLQVKIRGFRVELGEIETRLDQIKDVEASVVIAKKDMEQHAILIAFVIPSTDEADEASIISLLKNELPEYMVPNAIIFVDQFPMTPNKKVDRKALGLIDIIPKTQGHESGKPVSQYEIVIYDCFRRILETEKEINVSDSFFALGGHSLTAVKLINTIESDLQYKLTLKDVFDHPTVKMLADLIYTKKPTKDSGIKHIRSRTYYPITSPQYNIWLASQLEERSIAYNISAKLKIIGDLDKIAFEDALIKAIRKFEIFRTNFIEVNGEIKQKIVSWQNFPLAIKEYKLNERQTDEQINIHLNKVFDLENDPLINVSLFHGQDSDSYLLFLSHHIIMDGWSFEILIKDIINSYQVIGQKNSNRKKNSKLQFRDYVVWNQQITKASNSKNLDFYNQYLKGYIWKMNIPQEIGHYGDKGSAATVNSVLSSISILRLNAFGMSNNVTQYCILITVFNLLLNRIYGYEDICIGIVNSGRTHQELHDQVGMFAKTLPLRTKMTSDQSFLDILENIHRDILLLDTYQDIPTVIQEKLRLDVLVLQENPSFDYQKIIINENLILEMCNTGSLYCRLPLLISFSSHKGDLTCDIIYDMSLYNRETIELLTMKFEILLADVLKGSHKMTGKLSVEPELETGERIDINFNF